MIKEESWQEASWLGAESCPRPTIVGLAQHGLFPDVRKSFFNEFPSFPFRVDGFFVSELSLARRRTHPGALAIQVEMIEIGSAEE